jgi:hypothetical protein
VTHWINLSFKRPGFSPLLERKVGGHYNEQYSNHKKGRSAMLCVNKYTQKYIDECRSKVDLQISTYKSLVKTAKDQSAVWRKAVRAINPPNPACNRPIGKNSRYSKNGRTNL